MALNGKYISCQEVIRQVYRDFRYKYELPWQDAVEWSVDAIKLIGAPMALQPKQACITIDGFRGMLPCDLEKIDQAAGMLGPRSAIFAMRTSTNSFHPVHACEAFVVDPQLLDEVNSSLSTQEPIGEDINGNPVFNTGASGGTGTGNFIFPGTVTDTTQTPLQFDTTYKVNDNFIFPNFRTGFIFLAYQALPVDKDGFPLIPDNTRYIEAVKCYVRMKIDYILWRSGELTKDVYEDSRVEWYWYVGSAGNAARIPDKDGMQALMNQIKMIPSKYEHDRFFIKLGSK